MIKTFKSNSKKGYVEYDFDKSIENDKNNLIVYTMLEHQNLEKYEISIPFYHSYDTQFLTLNENQPVTEQIYNFLNGLYNVYSESEFLIVKLSCDFNEPILTIKIFPIISQNSPLGDNLRFKCSNTFDYFKICLNDDVYNPNLMAYHKKFIHYSYSNHSFIEQINYLNCGIFKYDEDGKVNKFEGWEQQYEELKKTEEFINRMILLKDEEEGDLDF